MKKKSVLKPKERKTDLQVAFGQVLREKRLDAGLSQEALAELSGLHFTYVSSVERGERNISLENISRLARALKFPMKDFFTKMK